MRGTFGWTESEETLIVVLVMIAGAGVGVSVISQSPRH